MALSDSILLQISQKKTTYNDLFTRILSNYSSVGSAKAALSRALKNQIAFGEIEKIKGYYILTRKGKQTVESKLKNKMLININNLLKKSKKQTSLHKDNLQNIDDIIKNLQMFIERSKVDSSFLKIGKTGGASFYISDLKLLRESLSNRVKHLLHLSEVLDKQIQVLKELDFEDIFSENLNKNTFNDFVDFIKESKIKELNINCPKESVISTKLKDNEYFLEKNEDLYILNIENIDVLKNIIFSSLDITMKTSFKIYINEILIIVDFGKIYFIGPYKFIKNIRNRYLKSKER